MCRTLGKMLFVCVLLSCFVYIVGYSKLKSSSSDTDDSLYNIRIGGPDHVSLKHNVYKPVPFREFERNIKTARNHFDLIRIFLKNKTISNSMLSRMLNKDDDEIDDDVDGMSGSKKRDYDYYSDDDYSDDPEELMEEAFRHYEEIAMGPLGTCSEPRPEVVRVRDITGDAHKIYYPKFTVLHRCRNVTGCCWDDSQECRPRKVQVVWKPFITFDYNTHEDLVEHNEDNVEWVLFENHTECSCQDLNPLPSCTSRCPYPFFMSRPHEECVCDCKSERSVGCNKIKYGLEPLGPEEFQCVKSNECMPPLCAGGKFDMRKGFCEGVPNSELNILHLLENDGYSHPRRIGRT